MDARQAITIEGLVSLFVAFQNNFDCMIIVFKKIKYYYLMPFSKDNLTFFKMKKIKFKLVLALLLWVISFKASPQELTLELSQHPNKEAVIVVVKGIRKDTLGSILLDQNGKGILNFKNNQNQAGLVNLTIKEKAYLSYDFVLSPLESPTIICDMEYVYSQNTTVLHSPENDCLNRWFDHVVEYKQKININQELSKLYKPKDLFLKKLASEKQMVEKQLQKLIDTINQSSLFAAKYMQFKIAQEEKLAKVWESNEQRTIAKNYFTQIDFDALYGSSMWFAIINSCMEAYVKESPFHETFGADVVENLKRIKNQQVYEDLIDAATSVTQKFAWNKDEETIVDFIVNDKRIVNPNGKLLKIMQSYHVSLGKKAPAIELSSLEGNKPTNTILKTDQLNSKYSLLVFYQSGCGHCETAIAGLKSNYQDIVSKGIKIITLSADIEQETYQTTADSFPWKDKFCDFKGTSGINFKNYAVMGTPTMFLLDNKGIIIEKIATVEQLLAWMKKG
jgi:peroxiredoxin